MTGKLSPLLAAERRARIAELVAQRKTMRISELHELFKVSEVTLRNDLNLLAKQGLLIRQRGGAIANAQTKLVIAFDQRASLNMEEKRRIGRSAAQLVKPGDVIIMDAGTTVMEMARSLGNVSPLTVVTNALNVAIEVGNLPDVRVILVGGFLSRKTICTVGPQAEQALNDLIVGKAFLGIHAFDLETGLTDTSIEIAQVKRAIIRASRKVILLADSSKWGCKDFAKVAPLSSIHTIITDSNLPNDAQIAIQSLGIELILG